MNVSHTPGTYIILEGTVGAGKTTQIRLLHDYLVTHHPDREVVITREPGGTPIAEQIRTLVQGTEFDNDRMGVMCEAYLYAAARAQLIETLVGPAIERGAIVVSDRSMISSLAYQGYAYGHGVEEVLAINRPLLLQYKPDCIVLLDIDPAVGHARTFDAAGDKHEKNPLSFFVRLQEGYRYVAQLPEFADRIHTVTVGEDDTPQVVHQKIVEVVNGVL